MMTNFDLCIIGGGPGGYVCALRAAFHGLKVVLIEKRPTLGGTCLNVGCIPSKTLLQSTEWLYRLREEGKKLGLIFEGLDIDYPVMMQRKDEVVKSLVTGLPPLMKQRGIEVITGEATLVSSNQVQVKDESQVKTIDAKNIVLATGSYPIEIPSLKFDEKRVLSSTGALFLENKPSSMAIVGAGVIGVEMASVFSRIGVKITIIEMLDRIVPPVDAFIAKQFHQLLKKQGIEFLLSSKLVGADLSKPLIQLEIESQETKTKQIVDADVVLVAVGRRPATQGLGIDKLGIKTSKSGQILVDGYFETSLPHVFAIGDIIEGPMLAHKASEEGVVLADFLSGKPSQYRESAIPNVVYTDPEVAGVGLTEEQVKLYSLPYRTGVSYFRGNPRARAMGDTQGLVKVLEHLPTGRLLGMHIMGPHASELIAEATLAMQHGLKVKDIAETPHAHPTLSEAIKEACLNCLKEPLHG